jgi:NAD(P)-dependent dehydrogenase (short-subunit alcohol dehydrogenase family)
MGGLSGQVALVTGASRGAGLGIAQELGAAGATVYVTGRSTRSGATTEGLPGTVEAAAEAVTARGGRGIAVACDHTDDAQVAELFARVSREQGRLDVLVNNVWGGYERYDGDAFARPFWEQPLAERWQGMFVAGLRAHLVASQMGARLMLPARRGLIVSTIAWEREKYLGALPYDVAKHAIARAIWGMARELRRHGVAAIALAPGFMRTERVLAALGKPADDPDLLAQTESPAYAGRAVVALAGDPELLARSGRAYRVGDLAAEFGFTDADGRQVPPFSLPDDLGER